MNAAEVISDLLARGHSVRFRATGHSMHPIIRSGEYLLVEPPKTIRRGDVVLTLADRGLTAHRVIDLSNGIVTTRGDNAPEDDLPVDVSRVLGVVTHAEERPVTKASGVLLSLRRLGRRLGLRIGRRRSG
jgi:SOS-response transcriptional repressor LexA